MRGSNPLARAPARHRCKVFQPIASQPDWRGSCSLPSLRLPSTFNLLDQISLPVQLLYACVEHSILAREQVGLSLSLADADHAHVLDLGARVAVVRDRSGLRQLAVKAIAQRDYIALGKRVRHAQSVAERRCRGGGVDALDHFGGFARDAR